MSKFIENQPTANILMNSMRSMGYTFEAAIADVIDNSISANATKIEVKFPIEPLQCYVAICDNGDGMTDSELFDAMKYGSENKGKDRSSDDLGRFGIGLKSSSLSQVRILTVASKKNNIIAAYRWDLNYIEKKKSWTIIKFDDKEIKNIKNIEYLDNLNSGTVVVWEEFDVIKKNKGDIFEELHRKKETVSEHIGLIFHRFIEEGLEFKINNSIVDCLDPFLKSHNKTNTRRKLVIPLLDSDGIEREIKATAYVLPFITELTLEDRKKVGGVKNYRAKQGFYVYRSKRLIIWGTWFGDKKEELSKNVRVKVDIPNTLDDIWQIDIKKQSANIPLSIRKNLKKAINEAMDISKRLYTHRGKVCNNDNNIQAIWNRIETREDEYIYIINREHILLKSLNDRLDISDKHMFNSILSEIENLLPYQQIYIDKAEDKTIGNDDTTKEDNDLIELAISIYENLEKNNMKKEDILNLIFSSEPFNSNINLREKIEKLI